jgi:phosphoribosylglycinamide formyltransferase-1
MTGDHPARPVLVASNDPPPAAWPKPRLGVPTAAIDHRPFGRDRAAFEAGLADPSTRPGPTSCALPASCAS